MGNLATHLQQQFSRHCPPGWRASHEVLILSEQGSRLLGYAPRADVLLEREDGSRRLWIEFEISRADPVANHAKFATAHLFEPQAGGDAFLSMVSPHVTGGRRNLAANMVLAMRRLEMEAYQTVLLPHFPKAEIKRLNYLSLPELEKAGLDIGAEITRALSVTLPALESFEGNIHYAANVMETLLNAYCWNRDVQVAAGRDLWGRRTVTYFVYDRRFGHFAPSKFCAYVPVTGSSGGPVVDPLASMNVQTYTKIERSNVIFDGSKARQHLADNLAMRLIPVEAQPRLRRQFERWLATRRDVINVHPGGAQILLPPRWF